MKPWIVPLVLLVLSLLQFAAGCGLPTIPFLAPPQNPGYDGINAENRILTFEHNPENDIDDFKGYELYYKLYTLEQTAAMESDINAIDSSNGEPGPAILESRGFVRAVATTARSGTNPDTITEILSDDPRPHLPTDPDATAFIYELDLTTKSPGETESEVIVTWDQSGPEARGFRRRTVNNPVGVDPTGILDGFWDRDGYDDTDYDINEMGLDDEIRENGVPDRFAVVWYAISYGIDGTSFRPYYSEALELEYAEIVPVD